MRRRLQRLLSDEEVVFVRGAGGGRKLWKRLPKADLDLVVTSRSRLPQPVSDLIRSVRELPEQPEVIVVTSEEDPGDRAALLAAGCFAVVNDRVPDATLSETLHTLIQRRAEHLAQRIKAERLEYRASLSDFVSKSPAMQAFLTTARRVVQSDSSLLLLGETGVGKERLARAIHSEGLRGSGPFIAINCGALPETLLESELFGHEEGSFTGATRARRGYFELAHQGTLFLDEIGEMPAHLQVKLLRAIENRSIQRVGGERALGIDARVMAATNRDLEADVAAKRFRSDLFYRLAVVTLTIPPLRERREDIAELTMTYIQRFRLSLGRPVEGCTAEAMTALVNHSWPGNVRELINVLERAVLLGSGNQIELADLPDGIASRGRTVATSAGVPDDWLARPLREVKSAAASAIERRYVSELLRATRGRVGETAKRAGVNERALYAIMKRHGLRKEDFRQPRPDDRS
jgi:DNA-binding NtrC family response regulator